VSAAKHTAGPWSRDRYGHVVGPDGEDVRFRSLAIAASGSAERPAEAEANTDLIAAAPDLLEALQATRGQWIHSVNAAQCLAAIAKATGSQP